MSIFLLLALARLSPFNPKDDFFPLGSHVLRGPSVEILALGPALIQTNPVKFPPLQLLSRRDSSVRSCFSRRETRSRTSQSSSGLVELPEFGSPFAPSAPLAKPLSWKINVPWASQCPPAASTCRALALGEFVYTLIILLKLTTWVWLLEARRNG